MMGPRPRPAIERFIPKIGEVDANGCWPWLATKMRGGHGQFFDGQRRMLAHRFSYELFVGPIPSGMHLHHVCRNQACVNPSHLSLTTSEEHTRLHHTRPVGATCKNGHPWVEENLYVYVNNRGYVARMCKTCKRALSRRTYHERLRTAA